MISDLELAFSELKSKSCTINDVSSRISAVEIGEIIQVDLGKVSASEVKRAIDMAARAGRKSWRPYAEAVQDVPLGFSTGGDNR